jgi:hypothetical protein
MKRTSPPDDRVRLFQRLVKGPAEAGEEFVKIPTGLALYILELAKRAPKLGRGPSEKDGRTEVREALVINRARTRKRELQDGGMSASEALDQAAKEASENARTRSVTLHYPGSNST